MTPPPTPPPDPSSLDRTPPDRAAAALVATAVGLFALAGGVAALLAPREAWLLVLPCALLAPPLALQAATVEPRELAWALLFALVPLVALAAEGSAPLLVVILGLLLFVACEVMALRWRLAPAISGAPSLLEQVGDAARLVGLGGVGAGIVLGISALALPASTLLLGLAALALAGAGAMVLASGEEDRG